MASLNGWYMLGNGKLTMREFDPQEPHQPYESDKLVGTLEYLSPEFILGAGCDHRADIYAVGLIAHELITGQRLYRCDDPMELMRLKVASVPPEPMRCVPSCPPSLSAFCMKAIAREPEQRYQTARECLYALQELSRDSEIRLPSQTVSARASQAMAAPDACVDPWKRGAPAGFRFL